MSVLPQSAAEEDFLQGADHRIGHAGGAGRGHHHASVSGRPQEVHESAG